MNLQSFNNFNLCISLFIFHVPINRQEFCSRNWLNSCFFFKKISKCTFLFRSACKANQFDCGDDYGGCIDSSLKCDGLSDCDNGLDERNCPPPPTVVPITEAQPPAESTPNRFPPGSENRQNFATF